MIAAMDDYFQHVEQIAGTYSKTPAKEPPNMTSPIAVAGLADTINNAVAGMARAKAAADALNVSATKLVGNIAAIESVQKQLDDANTQVEAAIKSVGGPLPDGESSGADASPQTEPQAPLAVQPSTAASHSATDVEAAAAQVAANNAQHAASTIVAPTTPPAANVAAPK